METRIVFSSVAADFDAAPMAHALVERHLAACVNIIAGVQSIFRWKGAIEHDAEQLLIIKTTDVRLDELREVFHAMHPYELPEFLVVSPTDVSESYRKWIEDATAPDTDLTSS